ncbi:MAG TPA: nitrilase-related carbon-nitrogen hydrolase, partial [Chitinophagaceae bacterium]|nr:nitrilase-related carbon-nitrogen hydrolase [Chitinophagaceae bacterium]
VGMPIIASRWLSGAAKQEDAGIMIGMIIFQPGQARQVYCKQHLHADEYPYFVQGDNQVYLSSGKDKLGLSICYELSVPEHSANLHKNGATVYISSVAKTAEGMKKAAEILPPMARDYSMTVLLSNCVGQCDNFDSCGKSAVWDDRGLLLDQLDDVSEGILLFDTAAGKPVKKLIC